MSKSTEFLDKIRGITELNSDNKIAIAIGKKPSQISQIRSGKQQAGVYATVRLAQLAGLNPIEELAAIQAEKAKSEAEKRFWLSQCESA